MLSAVVADGMTGDRHNSNVELVAQGFAKHCFSAVWRHSRHRRHRPHGTNIRAGARSPVSGMVHALQRCSAFSCCRAPRQLHPAHHAGRGALCCGLQTWAMEGDWRNSAVGPLLPSRCGWSPSRSLFSPISPSPSPSGSGLPPLLYIRRVAGHHDGFTSHREYIRDGLPHVLQAASFRPMSVCFAFTPISLGPTEKLVEPPSTSKHSSPSSSCGSAT